MKRLLAVSFVVLCAVVLGSALLITTGGELKAAEIQTYEGTGNLEDINVAALLCDGERMEEALQSGEKTRLCVVSAVEQDEEARKLIMKKMLQSPKVRSKIMETIATTPALRAEMEKKLAATK
jgi:hypothetical protein